MILEKCKYIGASPRVVLSLPEVEDDFLSMAIVKRFKETKGMMLW